ncbi:antibiotic biosynthesis monooxygenase [Frondihabitans sp. PAMC 28766]|uniref:putative quinol monooxygenase n=1 Tax=Frondihabitans sp. PAMC 28766 TaxID=1795630 RepID=UPI00078DDA12|nr:antibiotic biosynthesis monooxygenase [Frondihabitans sp. PAMC 28766]AMM22143.1 antibiotic biosynthesis monooxygenase [Frondihabitans sp. PAMC 28766]
MPDPLSSEVRLSGLLVCASAEQAAVVARYLPAHAALTRAEPGCVSFEVTPTADPLVWQVDERFTGESVFRAHQDRVGASEWGRVTAGIERRYSIGGTAAGG